MSRLSFQEKMLWAQLLGIATAVGLYARHLQHAAPGDRYFHVFFIGLIFLFAFVRTLVRRRSGNVVEDERDKSIACIGARCSNIILWVGLVAILIMYWDHGGVQSPQLLIGILFHLLVLAGVVRIIRELVAYRMAA